MNYLTMIMVTAFALGLMAGWYARAWRTRRELAQITAMTLKVRQQYGQCETMLRELSEEKVQLQAAKFKQEATAEVTRLRAMPDFNIPPDAEAEARNDRIMALIHDALKAGYTHAEVAAFIDRAAAKARPP